MLDGATTDDSFDGDPDDGTPLPLAVLQLFDAPSEGSLVEVLRLRGATLVDHAMLARGETYDAAAGVVVVAGRRCATVNGVEIVEGDVHDVVLANGERLLVRFAPTPWSILGTRGVRIAFLAFLVAAVAASASGATTSTTFGPERTPSSQSQVPPAKTPSSSRARRRRTPIARRRSAAVRASSRVVTRRQLRTMLRRPRVARVARRPRRRSAPSKSDAAGAGGDGDGDGSSSSSDGSDDPPIARARGPPAQ